jgi:hypothetical protein
MCTNNRSAETAHRFSECRRNKGCVEQHMLDRVTNSNGRPHQVPCLETCSSRVAQKCCCRGPLLKVVQRDFVVHEQLRRASPGEPDRCTRCTEHAAWLPTRWRSSKHRTRWHAPFIQRDFVRCVHIHFWTQRQRIRAPTIHAPLGRMMAHG